MDGSGNHRRSGAGAPRGVVMKTGMGASRIVDMLVGEQLPAFVRILLFKGDKGHGRKEEQACMQGSKKLKTEPKECTPEQVKECHGEKKTTIIAVIITAANLNSQIG